MTRPPWRLVSKALGMTPVVSIDTDGRPSLRIERYFLRVKRQQLPALPVLALVVHLGGARVSGGSVRGRASSYIPSFSVLMPPGSSSEWFFDGAVDVAVFYFTDRNDAAVRQLTRALIDQKSSFPFMDNLVSAATQQLVNELGRGAGSDEVFVRRLASVVVDQIARVLSGKAGQRISPDRLQLGRLNTVLDWLVTNLDKEITNSILAERAGLSESHFRHMFLQAMGISPIRYVQQKRIERARELLASTNLPIAHLATECGFVSQSYLTTCFRGTYGMTPARFRRAAK
jgi:AraC family transcriptional regulator